MTTFKAQTKMAELVEYVSEKVPGIVLEKKWNRLLRAISKELENHQEQICAGCGYLCDPDWLYCPKCKEEVL